METILINPKEEETIFIKNDSYDSTETITNAEINYEKDYEMHNTLVHVLANVYEFDDEYKIELLAPGVEKKDIEIEVDDNNRLIVQAQAPNETNEEQTNFKRQEFMKKGFRRSFQLPEDASSEDISAIYKNGIVSLFIPKSIDLDSELENSQTAEFVII
jgi:HSP20 family molecular chaperone IbpA